MPHHDLVMPITEAQARALRVDDTVTLQGTLFGIRDATQIALFDRGRTTRFDLAGHAVIHTAPNVRKVAPVAEYPTGYAPVCIGTTTSARMERFTRPLLRACGVRLIIGKGGLGSASLAAFGELGGAYLAVIGGTAALETTWVEAIEDGRSRRSPSRESMALSRARLRTAARGHGQPRRQHLRGGRRRGAGEASGRAGRARRESALVST